MSVDQVSSLAGGGLTGGGLGTVTGALQGGINQLLNLGTNYLDRFFPPAKREQWKAWLTKFATERPYLASFLLSQIALSGLPLLLFGLLTVTVFVFALLAGILVGVLGALLFVVVAVGFALVVLLPTLFFTTGAAVFIWLWGVGSYFIVKWFNEKDVPGIHTDAVGGLAKASGLSDLPLPNLNGDLNPLTQDKDSKDSKENHAENRPTPHRRPEKLDKPSATSTAHHVDGKENHTTPRKPVARPSSSSPAPKLNNTVDGAAKTTTGAVGNVTKTLGV